MSLPTLVETYPPRIFRTRLDELITEHQLDDAWLAEFLGVVPITARRIREGKDLKLSEAIKLAKFFHEPIEKIWRLNP